MAQFLFVSFNFQSVPILADKIEEKLAVTKDWARFSPTTWIVWTELTPKELYGILEPLRTAKQFSFVAEMGAQPEWYAFMSQNLIDWMRQERPSQMPGR